MKRLASLAVMVAWFCCGAFAQHGGGSHGGGGFSGSHGGFSGPAGGFSGRSAPAFHGGFSAAPRGGFSRPAPPMAPRMYAPTPGSGYGLARYGPAGFAPRMSSYPGSALPGRAFPGNAMRPPVGGPRMPSTTSTHRATYHSPNGGNFHNGFHNHNHVVFVNGHRFVFVNGFWPTWGWGYPWGWGWGFGDSSDNYDSSYAPQQPQGYYVPYEQAPPDDQQQPSVPDEYPQQPKPSHAPSSGVHSTQPASQALTVVFKDNRPPEQVYNYLLTPNTLTVLDQHRHDIPVDQINLEATAQVNIQAGVEFSLPVRTP